MKVHDFDGEKWREVPPEQVEEWNEFYRVTAAQLLAHGVQKVAAVFSHNGQDWMLSLEIHPIGVRH